MKLKGERLLPVALAALLAKSPFLPPAHGAGYEFEGIGARQVSRAGAAIADSDDWTALYYNPGNIVRAVQDKKKEIGIELFGGVARGKDSNSLSSIPGVGPIFQKDKVTSPFVLGALGAALPVGERGGFGMGFYTPLLQGVDFDDTSPSTGARLDYEGSAAILITNLSGSYLVTPQFSLGAGLNLLYGRITNQTTLVTPFDTLSSDLDGDGFALEGIFGLRYDPTPKWSLGAVYRTGGDVPIRGDATANSNLLPDESSRFKYSLRHPPTTGVGAAYRPSDRLTLSLDFNQSYWHRFSSEIRYDKQGLLLSNLPNTFDWKNTWKLRFGTRYGLSEATDLLAGYSFDHPALDARSIDLSTTVDVPMHRFSFGGAHDWRPGLESSAGFIVGTGTRNEGGVDYRLSGWQAMFETAFRY